MWDVDVFTSRKIRLGTRSGADIHSFIGVNCLPFLTPMIAFVFVAMFRKSCLRSKKVGSNTENAFSEFTTSVPSVPENFNCEKCSQIVARSPPLLCGHCVCRQCVGEIPVEGHVMCPVCSETSRAAINDLAISIAVPPAGGCFQGKKIRTVTHPNVRAASA